MQVAEHSLVSMRRLQELLGVPREELRLLAANAASYYRPFEKGTRGSGKPRLIDNPQNPLKRVQKLIKRRLLDRVALPGSIVGGVRGRSTRDGAIHHVGQPVVVRVDIKGYFNNIRASQVASMWKRVFGTSGEITWLLTRLTTFRNYVPQGAPSSSGIANLVALPFVEEIQTLCAQRGLAFSMYVDDVCFSGPRANDATDEIVRIIAKHGFAVSRKKTSVMPAHDRQVVTGLVVNTKVSCGVRRKTARRALLVALRDGVTDAQIARLRGQVASVAAANPKQAKPLYGLLEKIVSKRSV